MTRISEGQARRAYERHSEWHSQEMADIQADIDSGKEPSQQVWHCSICGWPYGQIDSTEEMRRIFGPQWGRNA